MGKSDIFSMLSNFPLTKLKKKSPAILSLEFSVSIIETKFESIVSLTLAYFECVYTGKFNIEHDLLNIEFRSFRFQC